MRCIPNSCKMYRYEDMLLDWCGISNPTREMMRFDVIVLPTVKFLLLFFFSGVLLLLFLLLPFLPLLYFVASEILRFWDFLASLKFLESHVIQPPTSINLSNHQQLVLDLLDYTKTKLHLFFFFNPFPFVCS